MRKLLIAGLALVLGAGIAGAQGGTQSQPTGPMGTPRGESDRTVTEEVQGGYEKGSLRVVTMTVRDVDAKAHKVMMEIQVSPEANITESGRPIRLDQLKEGDQVRASFDTKSGDLVKIQVTQKGTKSK